MPSYYEGNICPICSKGNLVSSVESSSLEHLGRRIHLEHVLYYRCSICNNRFETKESKRKEKEARLEMSKELSVNPLETREEDKDIETLKEEIRRLEGLLGGIFGSLSRGITNPRNCGSQEESQAFYISPKKLDIKYVEWLEKERERINRLKFSEIEWYDGSTRLCFNNYQPGEESNIGFIISGLYRKYLINYSEGKDYEDPN